MSDGSKGVSEMKKFEGSEADRKSDKVGAKKLGMSLKKYEKTAEDRRKDKAGQAKLDKKKK